MGGEYAGRPEREAEHLWLLALEREQIVAVAYREEAVAGRVDELDLTDDLRALIRQTLVWIWKDEELHAEYLRGVLLQRGGLGVVGRGLRPPAPGRAVGVGHRDRAPPRPADRAVAHRRGRRAGGRRAALTGQIPTALQPELRFQTFRRYCALNVALEASAELAYRRLVELAVDRRRARDLHPHPRRRGAPRRRRSACSPPRSPTTTASPPDGRSTT